MSNPIVSVIMPAFNCAEFVEKAIESIVRQTYQSIELLVADDASTDETWPRIAALASRDKRIRPFKNLSNKGYLQTCADLVARATGEFIAFQDADDWSYENRIAAQLEFLKKHRNIGACGTNFVRFADNRYVRSSHYPTDPSEIRRNIFVGRVFVCGATVMARREVFEKVGFYRTFFDRIGGEHHDWIARISDKFDVSNISDVLYVYRAVEGSITAGAKSPRSYGAGSIIAYLTEQRIRYGGDGVDGVQKTEFESFLVEIDRRFSAPCFPVRHNILMALQDGRIGRALRHWRTMLVHWPLARETWVMLARVILAISPEISEMIENIYVSVKGKS